MRKIKVGILTGCLFMTAHLAIAPALADIASSFSNVNISIIQMLITIPPLMSVPFSFLAGRLTTVFTKKVITLFSIAAILFGGCIPLVFNGSIWALLIACCLVGGGMGGLTTISSALICEYFDGEERSSLMGMQSAFVNVGGLIFTILGGQLSRISWKYAYFSYLLALPAIILTALVLPKGRIEGKADKTHNGSIDGNVFYIASIGFLFCIFMNTFNTNISLYVAEQKLGGSVEASAASAFCTFGGILAGIILKKVFAIFNKYIISFCFITVALGMGVSFIATNVILVCIGGFLIGFGVGVFAPAVSFIVSENLTAQSLAMGIAIIFGSCNLGNSVSPIVINALSKAVHGGIKERFLLSTIVIILIFFITIIKTQYDNKNYKLINKTNSN